MKIVSKIVQGVKTALSLPTILTSANSFETNAAVGSRSLNARGLHRWRVAKAAAMTARRRARLADRVRPEWREAFERDGFVVIENAVPDEDFEALRDAILGGKWPVRDMVQGDTITRRAAVDEEMLGAIPQLRSLLDANWFRNLGRYVSSFDVEPLYYLQSIIKRSRRADRALKQQAKKGSLSDMAKSRKSLRGEDDPQTSFHADTFHPSMKAWLFLEDVHPGEGAFTYVRGSHRLSEKRLDWEDARARSISASEDRMSKRGSFRISPDELGDLDLPQPEELAVKANTLVVADTFGFHARGPSSGRLRRVELWAYSRRNPFLPWLGLDPLSHPSIAPKRMDWLWTLRDRFPRWFKQPWEPIGQRRMLPRK